MGGNMTKSISISDLRANIGEVFNHVAYAGESIIVHRAGRHLVRLDKASADECATLPNQMDDAVSMLNLTPNKKYKNKNR